MYDVCIIGGGLAGLSFAIDMASRGYSVVVIEKGSYPRHKVCGEYLSMESYYYLKKICPALNDTALPIISEFQLSSTSNKVYRTKLGLGGIGISRYLLEELLYYEALKRNVNVYTKAKARKIVRDNVEGFTVETGQVTIRSRLVIDATGRKSNLSKMKSFADTNCVGVKYHVKIKRESSLIELHNFPGGYCGISNVEDEISCLCYIIKSGLIQPGANAIKQTEERYLSKNKHLKNIFNSARFVFDQPITISGINFSIKQPVTPEGIFNIGDSAGCVAPVTGNGMSMALRSASILAAACDRFFCGEIVGAELTQFYTNEWKREFERRIKLSRYFQKLSEFPFLTNGAIGVFNAFPAVADFAIRQTHGQPFGNK